MESLANLLNYPELASSQLLLSGASDANAATVSISDYLDETPLLLLYFSASWCGPCTRFTPTFASLYGESNNPAASESSSSLLSAQPQQAQ